MLDKKQAKASAAAQSELARIEAAANAALKSDVNRGFASQRELGRSVAPPPPVRKATSASHQQSRAPLRPPVPRATDAASSHTASTAVVEPTPTLVASHFPIEQQMGVAGEWQTVEDESEKQFGVSSGDELSNSTEHAQVKAENHIENERKRKHQTGSDEDDEDGQRSDETADKQSNASQYNARFLSQAIHAAGADNEASEVKFKVKKRKKPRAGRKKLE